MIHVDELNLHLRKLDGFEPGLEFSQAVGDISIKHGHSRRSSYNRQVFPSIDFACF
jgi:hypothetical protein